MANILAFIIKYRSFLIGAATILIIIIAAFFWMKSHDKTIRDNERMACNAEWTIKNAEAQRVFDDTLEKVKSKQKLVKPSPSAADFSNQLSSGKAFNPYGGQS